MNVAVNATGQCQQAHRIDLLGRALNALGNAHDAAFVDADIGLEFVAGSYNRAAADS